MSRQMLASEPKLNFTIDILKMIVLLDIPNDIYRIGFNKVLNYDHFIGHQSEEIKLLSTILHFKKCVSQELEKTIW